MKKKRYLVVYDYGQGGIWAYVCADSKEEIIESFPELTVFEGRPDWMNEGDEELQAAEESIHDISGPYHGLLADILAEREERT